MESLYLIILLFFIILLVFPVMFNIRGAYNMISNEGVLCVKVWFIKLIVAKFKISNGSVQLKINRKKKVEKEIEVGEPVFRFILSFQNEIKNKIKLKEVKTITKIGVGDPDKSALSSTLVSDVILGVFARLKQKNITCSFNHFSITDFNDYSMIFCIDSKFSFSLQDVIYSFLSSFLKTKGDIQNERI